MNITNKEIEDLIKEISEPLFNGIMKSVQRYKMDKTLVKSTISKSIYSEKSKEILYRLIDIAEVEIDEEIEENIKPLEVPVMTMDINQRNRFRDFQLRSNRSY